MSDAPAVQVQADAMEGKGVNVMPKKGGGDTLATALPLGGRRRRSTKGARRGSRRGGEAPAMGARRRRTAGRRHRGGLGETQIAARRRRH